MKKVLLFLAVAVSTLTAGAQVYVGGEVGFWRNWKDGANKTDLTIAPEVGYKLADNMSIGTTLSYKYNYEKGGKNNAFQVAPYLRYTAVTFGSVSVFLDGGFGFGTEKYKNAAGVKGDSQNSWEVGIKPGVSVNISDRLTFISHIGFLGYRDSDNSNLGSAFGDNGLGFNLSGNALTFGLYYNF